MFMNEWEGGERKPTLNLRTKSRPEFLEGKTREGVGVRGGKKPSALQ